MRASKTTVWIVMASIGLVACGGGGGGTSGGGGGGGGTTNTAPVANAGVDQTAGIGLEVSLDGTSSSDANGDSLTYSWTIDTAPAGSAAALSSTTASSIQITPDQLGDYVIGLVVNDGTANSSVDQVTITVVDSIDSLGLVDIVLRDSGVGLVADFHTPAPISDQLDLERSVSWTELADLPENLTRFSFGDDTTTDLFVLTDTATSVDTSLGVSSGLAADV